MTYERLPQHVERFLHDDLQRRQKQGFATPQGTAERAKAAQDAIDSFNTALRALAWGLALAAGAIALWIALPWLFGWIATRASADAAIAPVMMLF